jgi:hypothetical protein
VTKSKAPPRMIAAFKRVDVAVQHLHNAIQEIAAARADLSSVIGAPSVTWARLYEAVQKEAHMLKMYALDNTKCELDHDPTPAELHRGHGPDHGCAHGRNRI